MYKKRICYLLVAVAFALTMAGCASTGNVGTAGQSSPQATSNALSGAPGWVLNPQAEGALAELGTAPPSRAGIGFQRNEALASARTALARLLETRVKASFKSYMATTGTAEEESFDRAVTDVSTQLAKQTLVGAAQKDAWIGNDGTMYVLVVLDSEKVAEATKKNFLSSFKNDQALWQQFKAKKAQEELAQEIDKEFGVAEQ